MAKATADRKGAADGKGAAVDQGTKGAAGSDGGGSGRRGQQPNEKPWRRERPGTYVSTDERFRIEQEGPGRWFVLDQQQLDELGLARTTGPFSTLEDARAEGDRLRSMPATASPLLPRIAEARERQRKETAKASGRAAAAAAPGRTARGGGEDGEDRGAPETPRTAPPPPPVPAWLERLPPDEATRARRLIDALGGLGIADPERIVRSDVEGGRPAVARSLVARRLRGAALDAWQRPDAFAGADSAVRDALQHAAAVGLGDDELEAIVGFVARRTLAAALEQVSGLERHPDARAPLPGWQLVEHDTARPDRERRIDVTGDDVERLQLEPARDPADAGGEGST